MLRLIVCPSECASKYSAARCFAVSAGISAVRSPMVVMNSFINSRTSMGIASSVRFCISRSLAVQLLDGCESFRADLGCRDGGWVGGGGLGRFNHRFNSHVA